MSIFRAILGAAGRVSLRKRMMVAYWFFHTLMAAFVAFPLMGVAISNLSHSRYGNELLRGFDVSWLVEIIFYTQGNQAPAILPGVLLAVFLLFLGSTFLAGGAVRMLVHDGPDYSPRMFYEGCGRYFWRFLRLALYSLFFYGIALILRRMLQKLAERVWGDGMEDHQLIIAGWVVSGVLLLLMALVNTAMDYAKVRLVVDNSRKSLRAAFGSMRLVLTHPGKTMGVWLVLTIFLAAFVALYLPLSNALQGGGTGAVLALIVVQQLYVFARVWLRMMAWGAAVELDPFVRPKPEPPPEPVVVPVTIEPEPPSFPSGAEAGPEV
ncbi:hypothetical protein [uncultured Paludibaculum sp.]|uniref:hypothetical protein n=1 Tax=uncultured Paludibaculum sp. TaxID=1765020 RepID=UPI002AAAACF9|nr:hypothetical protein [uncultured Paludibaculum sp.]